MSQTLGQYFKDLRVNTRRFPVLDRAAVEAMGDKLGGELARRFWGMPRRSGKATTEEWVNHFLKQQAAQRSPTLRDVAGRANLDAAAVWKIEHDKPVRAETVRAALVEGLGYKGDSAEVRQALALWTGTKTQIKVDASLKQSIADVQHSATFNQFLNRLVPVAATIPASEYEAVLEALSNPATVESLAALNRLAATGAEAKKPKLRVVRSDRA